MEKEVEVIVLEDNQEYLPVKTILLNGIKYLVLSNIKNTNDICIRKEIEKNGETYISMLANTEELQGVLEKLQEN